MHTNVGQNHRILGLKIKLIMKWPFEPNGKLKILMQETLLQAQSIESNFTHTNTYTPE
jgi:hypothetical protein